MGGLASERYGRAPRAARIGDFLAAVISICVLALLANCRDRGARWAGKIQERDGISLCAGQFHRHTITAKVLINDGFVGLSESFLYRSRQSLLSVSINHLVIDKSRH